MVAGAVGARGIGAEGREAGGRRPEARGHGEGGRGEKERFREVARRRRRTRMVGGRWRSEIGEKEGAAGAEGSDGWVGVVVGSGVGEKSRRESGGLRLRRVLEEAEEEGAVQGGGGGGGGELIFTGGDSCGMVSGRGKGGASAATVGHSLCRRSEWASQ